jgi:hypothetical protein
MKKLNFILLAAICGSTLATLGQNKIEIGAEGGPSLAFLRGNELIKKYHSSIIGFSGGVTFQYNLDKTISLRTNLSYERKGCAIKDLPMMFSSNKTFHYRLNYITMPILVRASFGKKTHFFVNAGPYFGYLAQTIIEISNDIGEKEKLVDTDNPYLKKWDFGISAGLGVAIPLGEKIALSFEIRNNLGLYDINNSAFSDDRAVKNNSTNLLVGLAYQIGT